MQKYNKNWLIREIANRADFTIGDITIIINTFEDVLKQIIADKSELNIVGLFSLSIGEIAAHEGVNPKTNEKKHIEKSNRIKFKASKALYDLLK
jgi:nucleoid DNA-binding protein